MLRIIEADKLFGSVEAINYFVAYIHYPVRS
jgi:hypothetical protein